MTGLQFELAFCHLLLGRFSREAEFDDGSKVLGTVFKEVDGALPGAQDVLSRIAGIPAFQNHRIILFAGYVIWEAKGISSHGGIAFFVQSGYQERGHREKSARLVEIVYDAQIFE